MKSQSLSSSWWLRDALSGTATFFASVLPVWAGVMEGGQSTTVWVPTETGNPTSR